jgi:hypothetical protein
MDLDELPDENPRLIDELLLDEDDRLELLELLEELPDEPFAATKQGNNSAKIVAKTIGLNFFILSVSSDL